MSLPKGETPLNIAIVGSGIAGLSAAWLLSRRHLVTLFEKDGRLGGHVNSVPVPDSPQAQFVDTGFLVYNEHAYPNLTALFRHLGVKTQTADMSLSVSLDDGRLEYAGTRLGSLFAQPANVFNRRFWSMISDLIRFYREAPRDAGGPESRLTLGAYLRQHGYGDAFVKDHLLPMASAIWSAPVEAILDYPAQSFIRFHENHGLLKLAGRPVWRTVTGAARNYLAAMTASFRDRVRLGTPAVEITAGANAAFVRDATGFVSPFDHVVIATHADQALALTASCSPIASSLLGAFRYSNNQAVLHSDAACMPKRRAVWSSWNFIGGSGAERLPTVTYWLNRLQNLPNERPLFLTLNPSSPPNDTLYTTEYAHPLFDFAALNAQQRLWELQGRGRLWYCGSYFGYGFHEDALQSGLAVAEAIDPSCRRPWSVPNESGRIVLDASCSAVPVIAA